MIELLLSIIAAMTTAGVAIQGFFLVKVWSHEKRLTTLETTCRDRLALYGQGMGGASPLSG